MMRHTLLTPLFTLIGAILAVSVSYAGDPVHPPATNLDKLAKLGAVALSDPQLAKVEGQGAKNFFPDGHHFVNNPGTKVRLK